MGERGHGLVRAARAPCVRALRASFGLHASLAAGAYNMEDEDADDEFGRLDFRMIEQCGHDIDRCTRRHLPRDD